MFEYVSKYSLIDSDSREAFREIILKFVVLRISFL